MTLLSLLSRVLVVAVVAGASGLLLREPTVAADRVEPVDFIKEVKPLLDSRCVSCHGPEKQRGGLRLDGKTATLAGGDSGAAILPGKSGDSPLLHRVLSNEKKERMPPGGERLTAEQVALLRAWIDQGASWPDESKADPRKEHWAFTPVVRPELPGVNAARWPTNAIDYFILTRLEKEGLGASPEADRATLIRRLKFDLLGLPPTPEEVDAFVADKDPQAYEKLADKYLASPHYGERWARHWLDVVRFAESHGFEMNQLRPNAWPYRDYVIRALNDDKPYDRFVSEQLAGDSLGADEATGFLVGGPFDQVKSPDMALTLQQRADELHDMVSTTGSAFLGLTVGCARCHNHKFDPISQLDYYGMKAVFAGVQHGERQVRTRDQTERVREVEELRRRLAEIDAKLQAHEPFARPGSTLLLDDEGKNVSQLVPRSGSLIYQPGTGRGQLEDPGDLDRLPNLGRSYSHWNKVAGRDVFAWEPRVRGRFRVWLSWGSGQASHAADARYFLGDTEIARVDQRKFADGAGNVPNQSLWSGFFDAGVHDFTPESHIVLRGGDSDATVTADLLVLQAAPDENGKATQSLPSLRLPVNRLKNVEHFAPVEAKFVRMTITETTQLEPCIDELEVFSAGDRPRNVALASNGTRATASSSLPGYDIHKLEHINDGKYGNAWSWISNERGKGWVQLEFPEKVSIDRIIWSRDREEAGRYNDRTPTKYVFEVASEPGQWKTVASSDDRLPQSFKVASLPTAPSLSSDEITAARKLASDRRELEARLKERTTTTTVYAGKFTTPEATHRLHRGDATQKREIVAPAALAEFGTKVRLTPDAPEQERRRALAKWMTDPKHPLTARVLVNRLWQYHFGTGIVATPSDFGLNGAKPTHPELLDWLADDFVANGWHIKRLQRLIVLSSTYRQASTTNDKALSADAGTRLLWRYPPRRLEAEPLRDAILSVTGKLDLRMGGPGFDLFEPNGNYVKVYTPKKDFGPAEWRRLIYQNKPRMQLDDTFGSFDCPDGGQIAPKRNTSTTALQALNLLNSRFMTQQSRLFAERLESEAAGDVEKQVQRGFRLAFQREPAAAESAAAVKLVREHGLAALCRALLNANEFLYVY